ncbi:MAG: ribosome biogenesis GTPase Der [Patescibacteria group bacterium]
MQPLQTSKPRVALVGRTNVGKSTLWNRLTDSGRALVSPEPHTTRDRNMSPVFWRGQTFDLIDTGGMDVERDEIGTGIKHQSELAIQDADLILFVYDVQTGITAEDRTLAKQTRKLNKNVWLVANKTDNIRVLPQAQEKEAYRLGLGEPHAVSAATGLGVGDLLDEVLDALKDIKKPAVEFSEKPALRVAIIGRPNVGKSSLMNSILGEERVIVSAIAHTTREPQDTAFSYNGQDIILVDTAGMRKQSHVKSGLEEQGIERNRQAIADCDVAFLVFDATEKPTSQDRHLAGYLEDTNKGVILVANKWDLVEKKGVTTATDFEKLIRYSFPFLGWAPMVFVSALSGQRTRKLLDYALDVQKERNRVIEYNALNKILKTCIKSMKPLASYGPKSPRIYDVAQTGVTPPTFLVTVVGEKDNIHRNWVRFFEKRLREKFGFTGTSIRVKAQNVPVAKSNRARNVRGPGMEAVAGKIIEKPRLVNQTRKRQKGR